MNEQIPESIREVWRLAQSTERLIERVEKLETMVADKSRIEKLERTLFPETKTEIAWRDLTLWIDEQKGLRRENRRLFYTTIASLLIALFSVGLSLYLK